MSFKVIETQEEFDEAIKERLTREREKFADYETIKGQVAELTKELESTKQKNGEYEANKKSFDSQIAELNSKIKAYETDSAKTRIALEKGLPYAMASRLKGETEEDIAKDAESMIQLMKIGKPTPPIAKGKEEVNGDDKKASLKELLSSVKGDN